MTNPTCKDCPDRHPICHDSCPKYAEYKRQLKEQRAYTKPGMRWSASARTHSIRNLDGRKKAMKVLIACEESQEVCKAFRARGHEAYSCDLIEPSGGHPEWHILGDCLKAIEGGAGRDHGRNRA